MQNTFAILSFIFISTFSQNIVISAPLNSVDDDSNATSNDYELIFAHVMYRHGDRNIKIQYPNDPFRDPIHWPGGFGQLTKKGKMQLYQLGKYFRRRYDALIGEKYSPDRVFIRSTDRDRTLMSAQANLAGLFPPENDEELWNEAIMWQPIPVHTESNLTDSILVAKNCPKYDQSYQKYVEESEEVRRIYSDNADLFEFWSRMCGSNITTIKNVRDLYKTLSIEKRTHKKLPDWANKAVRPNGIMRKISHFHYQMATATPELARLKSGLLIKEMFDHFAQKINSTLLPDRTLWLYSAHETTIANCLNSLRLFEFHTPPYASSLHLELYKEGSDRYFIQIFYRTSAEEFPEPMDIPGCGPKCPFNLFYELYKHIIPVDYESECQI